MRSGESTVFSGRAAQAERTRKNILTAAREEFATLGLKGARTASIAAKANINPHAIFRYYGSKEGLYTAAVRSLFERNWYLAERERLLDMSPVAALETIIDYMIDRSHNDQIFVKIITDVNMNEARHIRGDTIIRKYYDDMITTISMIIEKGQREGVFSDVDPVFLYISLASSISAPPVTRDLYVAALEIDYREPAALNKYYSALKSVFFRGIMPPQTA